MEDFPVFVQDDKDRKTEPGRISETLHHCGSSARLVRRFAGIVVHVDINEIAINHFADFRIPGNEVRKAQTPRAPVAADLAYHELIL